MKVLDNLMIKKYSSKLLDKRWDLVVIAVSSTGIILIGEKLKNMKDKNSVLILTKGLHYQKSEKKILTMSEQLNKFVKNVEIITNIIEIIMHAAIKGIPIIPISSISKIPNLIPRQIIPSLKMILSEKFIPLLRNSGIFIKLLINIPIRIDKIIGDTGLLFKLRILIPIY